MLLVKVKVKVMLMVKHGEGDADLNDMDESGTYATGSLVMIRMR